MAQLSSNAPTNINYLTLGIMLQNHENENLQKIGKKCKNHF